MRLKHNARNLLQRTEKLKLTNSIYCAWEDINRFDIPGHISQYCKLYLNVINLADWFVVEVAAKRIRDL